MTRDKIRKGMKVRVLPDYQPDVIMHILYREDSMKLIGRVGEVVMGEGCSVAFCSFGLANDYEEPWPIQPRYLEEVTA